MTSIIIVLVYNFKGPAEGRLRVLEFLVTLKTHWWPSAVVCSIIGLLSLWHIPHFLSQFYFNINGILLWLKKMHKSIEWDGGIQNKRIIYKNISEPMQLKCFNTCLFSKMTIYLYNINERKMRVKQYIFTWVFIKIRVFGIVGFMEQHIISDEVWLNSLILILKEFFSNLCITFYIPYRKLKQKYMQRELTLYIHCNAYRFLSKKIKYYSLL